MLIEFRFQALLFQCCVQGFITDNDKTLEELFSESAEGSHKYNACLNTMATRIATVFASMRVGFTILYLQSFYTWMDVCFSWCRCALFLCTNSEMMGTLYGLQLPDKE
jgi:hypothetical protein